MVNVLPAMADIGSIGRTYGEPENVLIRFHFNHTNEQTEDNRGFNQQQQQKDEI